MPFKGYSRGAVLATGYYKSSGQQRPLLFLNFITALQHPGMPTSMPKLYPTAIQVVL